MDHNYETDPHRILFCKTMERARISRQRWLMTQIIGILILLALQIAFLYYDVLPGEYMAWWPLLIIVWGVFFVTRSILHGRRTLRYIEDYFERKND